VTEVASRTPGQALLNSKRERWTPSRLRHEFTGQYACARVESKREVWGGTAALELRRPLIGCIARYERDQKKGGRGAYIVVRLSGEKSNAISFMQVQA